MSKLLWDENYLRSFTTELLTTNISNQFWDVEASPEGQEKVCDFKAPNFRKMLMKFYPSLGVWNLVMGNGDNGLPTTTLVFVRGNRVQEIDADTLRTITYKIFSFMGNLGDELRANLYNSKTNPIFNKEALRTIPDLEDKEPFADNALSAYRFFRNGWVEISRNGVSPLRSYEEVPENFIIWNTSVIARDYHVTETKDVLEAQLQRLSADAIHPETGVVITSPNERADLFQTWKKKIADFDGEAPETHYKDFVTNLAKDDEGEVDETSLERLKLAIGYLCHRFHISSKRRWVLLVDKFFDGYSADVANGGNGKSLLIHSLSGLMNVTNLDGVAFTKGKSDSAALAPVTPATEIVHFDDASSKFDVDRLKPITTGDFHIRRLYKNPFSIPAKSAPKIAISSNHPLPGKGNTFVRRQFIVEVGNFYRLQDENYDLTPYEIHGYKHIASDEWNDADWSEYYRFVFDCISLYLSKGGLTKGGESEFYQRASLLNSIGSEEILDYLIAKLDEYAEHGQEVFAEVFYKEIRSAFPMETADHSNTILWNWLGEVGKAVRKYPNKHKNGSLDKQRLTDERLARWNAEGMTDWKDKNGKVPQHGDRVQVFKVSSMKNPASMVSKPDFSKGEEGDGTLGAFFGDN